MNIRQSIFGRMSNYVTRENFKSLLNRNRLDPTHFAHVPEELIEMMETIKNFRNKANILLDIGAYKGQFSQTANAFLQFQETICFEPNEAMHEHIKSNTQNKARIEKLALSDATRDNVTFYMHQDASMNSTVDANSEVLKSEFPFSNPDEIKTSIIHTITLDDYVASRGMLDPVFMIKIDTQGNELNILRHGINTLAKTEVCVIEFMFTSPYKTSFSFEEMNLFMYDNKFRCEGVLSMRKRPSGKISAVDFLYVKNIES